MRINNNLMAMNTHRQLGISTNSGAKSMEKLSSGFRINRAGDDAAGLAISEKMRGQIRGLTQASRNAQDGISLIQTAEGALNETHAILQRMRELAVQSSTDTNTDDDRLEIQKEIDQLATEITRISTTTQFNTMDLLDGTYEDKKFHIGANEAQNTTIAISDMSAYALKVAGGVEFLEVEELDKDAIVALGFTDYDQSTNKNAVKDAEGNIVAIEIETGKWYALEDIEVSGTDLAAKAGAEALPVKEGITLNGKLVVEEENVAVLGKTATVIKDNDSAAGEVVGVKIGDNWYALDNVHLDGNDLAAIDPEKTLDVASGKYLDDGEGNAVGGINVSTQAAADKAITVIDDAISTVSSERSKLGAMQNRLEHTIKNLDNTSENLQAAEARIRDVDMAKEIMEFTKQNILQQAATAMLAQANMAPQSVLQLLG
ncbi:MAG: flagellin [Firmicutes bacterium]|nr:flagellin [Bacillota bacterium]